MPVDESRVNELIEIFGELADTAGGMERTSIFPNLEVIDSAPAGLANYIIIRDQEGFYIPALRIPGIVYNNGDFVNVLFIKGTEPIAFQHGSSSGGGGVGGWPFSDTGNADPTDSDAQYSTITAAIAALSAGQRFEIGTNFTEAVTLNKQLTIVGTTQDVTVTTAASTPTFNITANNSILENFTINNTNTGGEPGLHRAVQIASSVTGIIFKEMIFICTVGGSSRNGLRIDAGSASLFDCFINATNFALDLVNTSTVDVYGGVITGSIVIGSGSTLRFHNLPTIVGAISGSGTVTGAYKDSSGRIIFPDLSGYTSGVYLIDESALLKVKQTDIPTAIAAAAASGDLVYLDADTYVAPNVADGITIDESLSIVGLSQQEVIITRADNTSTTMAVTDTPVRLRNLTIQHTGAGAGSSNALKNNQAGLVLENVYLQKTSGAAGNAIGLSQAAGDSLLVNCKINITPGTILNYSVYLHTAGSTCVIEGGEILAGTLVTAHASAVLDLRGVRLASGVTIDTSGGGTVKGWYIDSDGDIVFVGQSYVTGYSARVYNTGNISTSTSTWTLMTFNSEEYDYGGLHSTVSNTGRLTAAVAGIYNVTGHASFDANGTAERGIRILINNTTQLAVQFQPNASGSLYTEMTITAQIELAVTDYVTLEVFQNSGGNLNIVAVANYSPSLAMQIVSKS